MCGIAGIVDLEGRAVSPAALTRMWTVLRHRGPDGEGFALLDSRRAGAATAMTVPPTEADRVASADVALAHRRLAIIDLTPTGHQPMASDDSRLWIVYNGEVYNYVELRQELVARGHRFRGTSDTEVILRAYEAWGPDCVERFNGMWAFALWDGGRRQLVCSRDRFGVKPLYYAVADGRLVFASEIKALLASGYVEPRVNDRAVHAYLRAGYGYTDEDDTTFFAGVEKVPPASSLIVRDGRLTVTRFWALPDAEESAGATPAEFSTLFEDAVRLRLRSDVRVGGALSGGLDSSSVTCVASRLLGGDYDAFSVCYDDPRYDEREFMLPVVHKTGVRHHVVIPPVPDFAATVERLLWHQDEPFPNLNIYAQFVMYGEVQRQGVKVFLNGHGGDEALGGYAYHHLAFLADVLRTGDVARFRRELAAYAEHEGLAWSQALRLVLRRVLAVMVPAPLRAARRALGRPGESYLDPGFAARIASPAPAPGPASLLKAEMRESIGRAPLPAWLRLEDRNSMAFSIESRTPFLDYRLVELLFRLPVTTQVQNGFTKALLRDAMRGELPEDVRVRRDKKGFQSAAQQWFRGELAGPVRELLDSPRFRQRGYLDVAKVTETFERHRRGAADRHFAIWSWVCLELWLRIFIDEGRRFAKEIAA